jgi:nucleoside-diphosphate-sugar epimerase
VKAFVIGGAGAIGRLLVPELVRRGHDVAASSRDPQRAAGLAELGAEPVVLDAMDADAVDEAVGAASPEVVVSQVTSLTGGLARIGELVTETARVRLGSTRNAVAASKRAGVGPLVAQGVAFAYAPGSGFANETEPLADDEIGRSAAETERAVLESGLEGVVARYGYFYGPGTWHAREGAVVDGLRAGSLPARGSGEQSLVHVGDAASATALLCERGEPGAYNVVDDDPAPRTKWLPAFAGAIGAPAPEIVSDGPAARGASNAKLRALGWEPCYPSWRQGFREGLG